jgi:hypothetical protein
MLYSFSELFASSIEFSMHINQLFERELFVPVLGDPLKSPIRHAGSGDMVVSFFKSRTRDGRRRRRSTNPSFLGVWESVNCEWSSRSAGLPFQAHPDCTNRPSDALWMADFQVALWSMTLINCQANAHKLS